MLTVSFTHKCGVQIFIGYATLSCIACVSLKDEITALKNSIEDQVTGSPNGSFQNPVPSCKYIERSSPSGHYWIQSATTGYASLEYCDMTRQCCSSSTRGWMRVADFDMADPKQECPNGFSLISQPKRLCTRSRKPGCTSITYSVRGTRYQRVCGRATGYQFKSTDAFKAYYQSRAITIDDTYVDGISITHGHFPASIYGHLPVRTMQIMLDIRHARVHEMMSNTLELCLLSFRTSISVKLELHAEALAGGTSYTIPFGMGLDAARPVHVAPSIIHLGFAMSFRNQPLITSKFGSALIRETVTKICPLRRLSCMFSNKSLFCCIDSCCKVL